MVYHMGRVVDWWANNSVAFYPTNIQRQDYMGPLAEYIVLQFFVLCGGSDGWRTSCSGSASGDARL